MTDNPTRLLPKPSERSPLSSCPTQRSIDNQPSHDTHFIPLRHHNPLNLSNLLPTIHPPVTQHPPPNLHIPIRPRPTIMRRLGIPRKPHFPRSYLTQQSLHHLLRRTDGDNIITFAMMRPLRYMLDILRADRVAAAANGHQCREALRRGEREIPGSVTA